MPDMPSASLLYSQYVRTFAVIGGSPVLAVVITAVANVFHFAITVWAP